MKLLTVREKILIDFCLRSLIHFSEKDAPMSPQKYLAAVRPKRGRGISQSKEGIFIVERRKYPRFRVDLPLGYSVESVEHHGGVASNASKGGLLVYLSEAIFVGSLLNIEILFSKGSGLNSISATARVVWSGLAPKEICGEYKYGLKFESFQEGNFPKLRKLLIEAGEAHTGKEKSK
jgi:c-di-GMP-binding flagellar brake protein YcgR